MHFDRIFSYYFSRTQARLNHLQIFKMSTETPQVALKHTSDYPTVTERVGHLRSSLQPRDAPKRSPKATASHGQLTQKAIDLAQAQQTNSGTARRRASASASEASDNAVHYIASTAQTHKPLHSRKYSSGLHYDVAMKETNKVPLPERSERRSLPHTVDTTKTAQMPSKVQFDGGGAASTTTGPQSVTAYEPGHLLKQNAEYFDTDHDGVIWPKDTYSGFRRLGMSPTIYSSVE